MSRADHTAFAGTILLSPEDAHIPALARACFDSMPALKEIQVLTETSPFSNLFGQYRLRHDRTWYWFDRPAGNDEEGMEPSDIADDKAAAAVARFNLAADWLPPALAHRYACDDTPVALIFYRSGNMLLVENVSLAFGGIAEELAPEEHRRRLKQFHPVFANAPSGHDLMEWMAGIAQDIEEIDLDTMMRRNR